MLSDVIMPEMDGYGVLAWLKQNPFLRDLPVIMISALDETQEHGALHRNGSRNYLAKPFDPVLLRARIGASLEKETAAGSGARQNRRAWSKPFSNSKKRSPNWWCRRRWPRRAHLLWESRMRSRIR